MDQDRLREAVDKLPPDYIKTMWKYTIDHQAEAKSADNVLPYMPVVPEQYGVELTASSLVVDVGCLGGYGMFDFVRRRLADDKPIPRLVGIDIDMTSLSMARRMADVWSREPGVEFMCAKSEHLGVASQSVDIIIARLLLPYVAIRETLDEFARVIRPGGLMIIQIHTSAYYRQRLLQHPRQITNWIYHIRPLLSGAFFAVTGRQPAWRRFRETAMTMRHLLALQPLREMVEVWRDSDLQKPLVVLRK